MRIETAHRLLDEKYEEAKRLRYVKNKVAWAVYEVWREADAQKCETGNPETFEGMPDIHRGLTLDSFIGKNVKVVFTDGTWCDGILGYSEKTELESGHKKGHYFLRRPTGDIIFRKSHVAKIKRKID